MAADNGSSGAGVLRPFTIESLRCVKARISKENERRKEMEKKLKDIEGENGRREERRPALSLAAGRHLAPPLADGLENELIRVPLEEVDPFYLNQKTFILVNKSKEIFRFNSSPAIGLLSPVNPLRRVALSIQTHEFFPWCMWFVIAIHFYFMIMPPSPVIHSAEVFFTAIFTFEMVTKISARGLILGKFTYLRDPWNWLDFVLVIIALITVEPNMCRALGAWKTLRTLRLLQIPIFSSIVGTIVKSFLKLRLLVLLMGFFLFVFAVIGLQVYMGILTHKCVRELPQYWTNETWPDRQEEIHAHNSDIENWMTDPKAPGQYPLCGSYAGCPEGYNCIAGYGSNPDYGYTSFDSFGWALLSSYRIATQDFWEELYRQVIMTAGAWHVIFFIIGIFLGSFYFVNLIASIVLLSYEEVKKVEDNEKPPPKAETGTGQIVGASEDKNASIEIPNVKSGKVPNSGEGWCSRCCEIMCVWDCGFPWKNLQNGLRVVAFDPLFALFIFTAIVINTLFMAMDHYGMEENQSLLNTLRLQNKVFTIIFVVEAGVKLIAMSPRFYFRHAWNRFDFVVAVLPVIELMFEDANLPGISALRSFRLLRIIRLGRFGSPPMVRIVKRSIAALGYLVLVGLIIVGTFAVLGMHLYEASYFNSVDRFPGSEMPRWNLTDFWHSFMIVFRALCGEWIESMWDCMYADNATCIKFFVAADIIGNLIIVPMCLALVLRATYEVNVLKLHPPEPNPLYEAFARIHRLCNCMAVIARPKQRQVHETGVDQAMARLDSAAGTKASNNDENVGDIEESKSLRSDGSNKSNPRLKSVSAGSNEFAPNFGNGPWGSFRLKIFHILISKYFETGITIGIVLSCIFMAMNDVHLKESPDLQTAVNSLDKIFAVLFLLEMFAKWIGFGVKKYFSSHWCRFEFFIVLCTFFNLVCELIGCGSVSILRTIGCLRALRLLDVGLLRKLSALRTMMNAFVGALRPALQVMLVCGLLWLVFAIMGIQLFNGKFYKCEDAEGNRPDYRIVYSRYQCEARNYTWLNSPQNFDHLGKAFLSLFQVATFKGWIPIMADAVDSRNLDDQPHREVNFVMFYYFVIFIIIGAFLTRSLLVSVIITAFRTAKDEESVIQMGDDNRSEYNKALQLAKTKAMNPAKPIPAPTWKPQAMVYNLVTNPKFESFFMSIIILNVFVMSWDHYQQSQVWDDVLTVLNGIFTAIFVAEAVIKIFALRGHYFRKPWNVFDFIVALLSLLGLLVSDLIQKYFVSPTLLRILRVARIETALRPFQWTKGIRFLLQVLRMSFPYLFSVCIILFLLIYVYAIFGIGFFMNVELRDGLLKGFNFQTFGEALLLLIPISTGAGWDGTLAGLSREDDCDEPDLEFDKPGTCGSQSVAILFMVTYTVICWYFIYGAILAVIFINYSEANKTSEEGLTEDDLDNFYSTWSTFAPDASNNIRRDQLPELFDKLSPPLKINTHNTTDLNIPTSEGGMVNCNDVLEALIREFFDRKENAPEEDVPCPAANSKNLEEESARLIQSVWRKHKKTERKPGSPKDAEQEIVAAPTSVDM